MMHLFYIPLLPLIGFAILLIAGRYLSRVLASCIGVGAVALSASVSLSILFPFLQKAPEEQVIHEVLWQWFLGVNVAFHLDALSMLMVTVVTCVGSLIMLYSVAYMWEDEDFSRFFATMNLFVASMLVLLLADNFLLLFLGWEGVGVCSYLLVGFWYKEKKNGYAAIKAFLTTRTGDIAFLIGIITLYTHLGTLQIQQVAYLAASQWELGGLIPTIVGLCLLGGAVGKSAQLPLQTWLPDAMLGPTPVSALIHAATMVTAGVYLIARNHVLFDLAPIAHFAVLIIGAATLIISGLAAFAQRDLKRVLAYSTISQIGYMFLALGAGAFTAGLFHFTTHAFFKALLFLCAGAIGHALHKDFDMANMGGLRHKLPQVFWPFLIGALCLSGFPFISSGFYSKEFILSQTYSSDIAGWGAWLVGTIGVLVTALYTFRMVFLTFFGKAHSTVKHPPDWRIMLPLSVLAFFALAAGFAQTPAVMGGIDVFSRFLEPVLPTAPIAHELSHEMDWILLGVSSFACLLGIALMYWLYVRREDFREQELFGDKVPIWRRFLAAGLGFDVAYELLFIRPYRLLANFLHRDIANAFFASCERVIHFLYGIVSRAHNGRVASYVSVFVFAGILLIAVMVFK